MAKAKYKIEYTIVDIGNNFITEQNYVKYKNNYKQACNLAKKHNGTLYKLSLDYVLLKKFGYYEEEDL